MYSLIQMQSIINALINNDMQDWQVIRFDPWTAILLHTKRDAQVNMNKRYTYHGIMNRNNWQANAFDPKHTCYPWQQVYEQRGVNKELSWSLLWFFILTKPAILISTTFFPMTKCTTCYAISASLLLIFSTYDLIWYDFD